MTAIGSPSVDVAASARVPFYDQRGTFEADWTRLRKRIATVMDHGKYSHGAQVAELETELSVYTGARHAIGVNSGTDALQLLFRAAGIGPGDEVIMPCFTWISPASTVARIGARPVFVDVEPDSYTIDVDAARAALNARTKAIVPVHLFNQMADMAAVLELSEHAEVQVIEDSAEAIGMWQDGTHAGLLGRGGVLSFFPTKTLGTLGDAGMILTDDALIADRCRILRHHGRMGTTLDRISGISQAAGVSGTNSKMDDILAAVLLTRLTHLSRDIARRAWIAHAYDERLAGLKDVVRTPQVVVRPTATNPVWYVYVVEAERRDDLAAALAERGIGTEVYYPRPLHLQPCFATLGGRAGEHPVAEHLCRRTLALPLYPDMTLHAVDIVTAAIAEFYGR